MVILGYKITCMKGRENMGYSMSFDASTKVHKGDIQSGALRRWMNHNGRELEDVKDVNHSNVMIDPERTEDNESYYYSKSTGRLEKCTKVSQIQDALEQRLQDVKKPLRYDAVIARGLILQLDPEWYEDNEDSEQSPETDMIGWAQGIFGEQNVIGVHVHRDETNPHLHITVCPVTEDGRLNQKYWFPTPSAMRAMHTGLRDHMINAGYDVSMENKSTNAKHRLTPEEYKVYAGMKDEIEDIEWQKSKNAHTKQELTEWADKLKSRDVRLLVREEAVKNAEQSVKEQLLRAEQEKAKAEKEKKLAKQMQEQAAYMKQLADDREKRLQAQEEALEKQRQEYSLNAQKALDGLNRASDAYEKAKDTDSMTAWAKWKLLRTMDGEMINVADYYNIWRKKQSDNLQKQAETARKQAYDVRKLPDVSHIKQGRSDDYQLGD